MQMRVFYHDHCFDGACSASVFTRLHRECVGTATEFDYVGLSHQPGRVFNVVEYGAGENAVVDFKYSNSPQVTWWFDHHDSAFLTEADREEFERGQRDGSQRLRKFFDRDAPSCTGFIARMGRERFGWDTRPMAELIRWADIVDGAKYESALQAVEMKEPAMQLTLVLESATDSEFGVKVIPLLTEMPLGEIVRQGFVQERLVPQLERHRQNIEALRGRLRCEQGVIAFDITDTEIESYNKFIPYYLLPEATYTVSLSRMKTRIKLGVGTSPWTKLPAGKLANVAEICVRHGGGGHARVGAASFDVKDEASARTAAAEVVAELRARA